MRMSPWASVAVMAGAAAAILGMAAAWTLSGGETYTMATRPRPSPSASTVFVPLAYCDRMGCTPYHQESP